MTNNTTFVNMELDKLVALTLGKTFYILAENGADYEKVSTTDYARYDGKTKTWGIATDKGYITLDRAYRKGKPATAKKQKEGCLLYIGMEVSELVDMKLGSTFYASDDGVEYKEVSTTDYANYSGKAKTWGVATDKGYITLDRAYRGVLVQIPAKVEPMPLAQFKALRRGDVVYCQDEQGNPKPYILLSDPEPSETLENMFSDEPVVYEADVRGGYIKSTSAFMAVVPTTIA